MRSWVASWALLELLDSIPGATGQDLKYRTGRNMGSGAQIPRLKAYLSHLPTVSYLKRET